MFFIQYDRITYNKTLKNTREIEKNIPLCMYSPIPNYRQSETCIFSFLLQVKNAILLKSQFTTCSI